MNDIYIIGLTGPSGAGKSTVVSLLRQKGLVCVDADQTARQVTEKGAPCLDALQKAFGSDILLPDGSLNRRALADIAFSTPENTKLLNDITHPVIIDAINLEIAALRQSGCPAVLLDAPTLFQSGADRLCDRIIVVTAPPETRLQRIMQRDHLDQTAALARMHAALPDEFFTQHADDLIQNNADLSDLQRQVDRLYATLQRMVPRS